MVTLWNVKGMVFETICFPNKAAISKDYKDLIC